MPSLRPVFVVAGIGNGSGTGASSARIFSKAGYSVALIARGADSLNKLAEEINTSGGEAAAFPIPSYSPSALTDTFKAIQSQFSPQTHSLRAGLFNASVFVRKPFLEITPEEVQTSLESVTAAFAFSREILLRFKENSIEDGKRGTLLFTGATASLRGNTSTAAFATAKFGIRALSQSLAKEFGPANIHVSHVIIDGVILTDKTRSYYLKDEASQQNEDIRLSPDSIAESYLYLVNQDRSAWSWELDLRPAHEKW